MTIKKAKTKKSTKVKVKKPTKAKTKKTTKVKSKVKTKKPTLKQKKKLLDILKFTPQQVTLSIYGYGGECVIGEISSESYDYFKNNNLDVEEFSEDYNNELEVPEEFHPFEPGAWHDCDNIAHESGAGMDHSSFITITNNDTRETLFESTLDTIDLQQKNVVVDGIMDVELQDSQPGTCLFIGNNWEKGTFMETEFTLTSQFDPAKLRITYDTLDNWSVLTSVAYDGQNIDGRDNYSTTTKSSDYAFARVLNENRDLEYYKNGEGTED
jgi:leucine-rich repeat protein SHOC2